MASRVPQLPSHDDIRKFMTTDDDSAPAPRALSGIADARLPQPADEATDNHLESSHA